MNTTDELCRVLEEIISLIISVHGENSGWATWMKKSLDMLRSGDFRGAKYLLGAYGGMGSFNDYGFSYCEIVDGKKQINKVLESKDKQLEQLRARAQNLANTIIRETTFEDRIKLMFSDVRKNPSTIFGYIILLFFICAFMGGFYIILRNIFNAIIA